MDADLGSNDISVVIPTFNRAALLARSLESLACQTIPHERYEVVVADDGSTDETRRVVGDFSSRMSLKYLRIDHQGISAAKNAGLATATRPIVLFFDDDDVADPRLLSEHLRTHRTHPEEHVAVLGFTTWDPALHVTPLMEWLTDLSGFLFSYEGLTDGQMLPFSYFWGGRSSCKQSFLLSRGRFNEAFRSIAEDIELGYRLSKHGFGVVFNRRALSFMVRAVSFDEYWKRCERTGQALSLFSRLNIGDPAVEEYCVSMGIATPWDETTLEEQARHVRELESSLDSSATGEEKRRLRWELQDLYWWTFTAVKARAYADDRRIHHRSGELRLAQVARRRLLQSEMHRRAGEREELIRTLRRTLREEVAAQNRLVETLQSELQTKVGERDRIIRSLQEELHAKVAERDNVIDALQRELGTKTAERDRRIVDLQQELQTKVEKRDRDILDLQAELRTKVGDRDRTVLDLQHEKRASVAERDRTILDLQRELHERVGERDRTILQLRDELHTKVDERDAIIAGLQHELQARVGERDGLILQLQDELHTKVQERDRMIEELQRALQAAAGSQAET